MSGNPDEIDSPSDVTSFGNQQLQEQRRQQEVNRTGRTTPKLQAVDSNGNITREIKPDVVTRFGGTKPFDTTSTQLQDGQTVVDERGDTNIRLNMEMVLTFSQFQALNQITNLHQQTQHHQNCISTVQKSHLHVLICTVEKKDHWESTDTLKYSLSPPSTAQTSLLS